MKGITPKQRAKSLTTLLNKTYDPHGARRNVIDMLTDLRHLCDVKGWDFADLDRHAYQHYVTEKEAGGLVA
jgi:hypothetical protein